MLLVIERKSTYAKLKFIVQTYAKTLLTIIKLEIETQRYRVRRNIIIE